MFHTFKIIRNVFVFPIQWGYRFLHLILNGIVGLHLDQLLYDINAKYNMCLKFNRISQNR